MKHIPLRSLPDAELGEIRTADVVRQVIRQPLDKQKGADIEELRKGIRIFDALDSANGSLELEDADWEHLVSKLNSMQWGLVDRRLVQIVDDVLKA